MVVVRLFNENQYIKFGQIITCRYVKSLVSLHYSPYVIHYKCVIDVGHIHPINSEVFQVPVSRGSSVTI